MIAWFLGMFALATVANSENVLVLNSARISPSHTFYLGKIADVLADAGHNVTFFQQAICHAIGKVEANKATVIERACVEGNCDDIPEVNLWKSALTVAENYKMFGLFAKLMAKSCKSQLQDGKFIDSIRLVNYKIAIIEYFDFCGYAIAEKAGIKKFIAATATFPQHLAMRLLGHPVNLGFVPGNSENHGSKLTYLQRVKALLTYPLKVYLQENFGKPVLDVIRGVYRKDFDSYDVVHKSSYFFVNADEQFAFQQPLSEKYVFVGGIGETTEVKTLPKKFSSVFEKASRGVIFVSFGTTSKSSMMSEDLKLEIVKTAKSLPEYEFIWKYEIDDTVGQNVSNLHKFKWVPQADLLGHPQIRAFVSHGGLNSVSETIRKGKPFVCIPLFGDQSNNCYAAKERGLAVILHRHELNHRNLVNSLKEILTDENYQARIQEFSQMIASKPMPSNERVVKHTEYAMKFNLTQVYDLPCRSLSTIQYYFIDVLIPMAIFVFASLYVSTWLIRKLILKMKRVEKHNKNE